MSAEKKVFDVVSSRLQRAVHLIEASAGTGKTYAIAMLVLRFVTESALKIEDILLVTFTRAATEELAERIRKRLVEGRRLLEGSAQQGDETLCLWAETVSDPELALQRIRTALIDIDRAQIFTIHGFCQRMLQEQALESGQLFDVELQPDNDKVHQRVLHDFWRKHIYALPGRQCGVILSHFAGPEQLHRSVAPLSGSFAAIEPRTENLQEIAGQFELSFEKMRSWWSDNRETLHDDLENLLAEGKMKKKFSDNFSSWWQSLNTYFQEEGYHFPEGLRLLQGLEFAGEINGSKVRGARKKELLDNISLPGDILETLLEDVQNLLLSLRTSYAAYFIAETEKRMVEHAMMSYDDLIVRLHRAVTGASAKRLVTLLQHRFQAAVIDEFQDTDALQWRIFSTVFGGDHHFLYLIGDPKQAIYKFRGADIHSYFLAKQAAAHTLTLTKNYRSHPGCVSEINALFSGREKPFFYDETMLDFSPVQAALGPKDNRLEKKGKPLENMVFCQLEQAEDSKDGTWTSAKAAASTMRYVVREIVTLLQDGISYVSENENGTEERSLQPGDIAILVRQNDHAEQYQTMLAQAGVSAVLAGRSSVFLSAESDELYTVLRALASPGDIALLKRAMSVSWFGLSGDELYRIWQDDKTFDSYYSRFQSYNEVWQKQGVLLMLKRFLAVERVFITLGAGDRAERKIANIHHLMELLQQAEEDYSHGPAQLLQWLRRNMDAPTSEYELRLESDDDAVHIVTMHGAKGLEYPVVFCPALWYRQTRLEKESNRITCHEDGGYVLDLGSEQFERRREEAIREDMAEDLRLCYVALTRAKVRCYVMWCDYKGRKGSSADSFDSGIGYLLYPGGRVPFVDQKQILEKKGVKDFSAYQLMPADLEIDHSLRSAEADALECVVNQRQRGPLFTERQMTSYSALVAVGPHVNRFENDLDAIVIENKQENESSAAKIPFAALPSGPNFGNVVHDILESIPFRALTQPESRLSMIMQICRKYGVDADSELLLKLLRVVVSTPLCSKADCAGRDFSLSSIKPESCVKEMGFYYHLHNGNTRDINRLLADEKTVGVLGEKSIEGFLTGFVDLIFQHDGRFFIVDYKTNNLGDTAADYTAENLIESMAAHNYGLQYYLYTLVVHRYLKNFLAGYDYASHFGGVLYLFVRGMDEEGSGIFFHKPDLQVLEKLGHCFGS